MASYACEAVALAPGSAGTWLLGRDEAGTPRLAVRWLRGQAIRIARALDPEPGGAIPGCALHEVAPIFPTPGSELRAWAYDTWDQGVQMERLKAGMPVRISVCGPDRIIGVGDRDIRYVLTSRPVLVASSRPLRTYLTALA